MTSIEYDCALGLVIKRIRTLKNLRQSEVVKAIGISQSSYCRIENGTAIISPGKLKLFANLVKIPIQTIFCLTEILLEKSDQDFIQKTIKRELMLGHILFNNE